MTRTTPGRPATRRAARPAAASLAAAAVALAGCFGTQPAREFYRLRPAPADAAAAALPDARLHTPLTVESYATPGLYAEPGIVYRVGETQYGAYPNREWALPLGTMLATLTAESLRQLPGGALRVEDGARGGRPRGLVWRGTVRQFEEVDRGRNVSAAVRLDAELVRGSDDSVLWRGSAAFERPVVPAAAMTAVVDSLAVAAGAAVAELVRGAGPALRTAGTVAPTPDRPGPRP